MSETKPGGCTEEGAASLSSTWASLLNLVTLFRQSRVALLQLYSMSTLQVFHDVAGVSSFDCNYFLIYTSWAHTFECLGLAANMLTRETSRCSIITCWWQCHNCMTAGWTYWINTPTAVPSRILMVLRYQKIPVLGCIPVDEKLMVNCIYRPDWNHFLWICQKKKQ